MGYFDPDYYKKEGTMNGPVVNAGKHIYYKDGYILVDRIKDLAKQGGDVTVRHVVIDCFRDSVLILYFTKLTKTFVT